LKVMRECVSDLGAVASDSTAFRTVDRIASEQGVGELGAAHARARERSGSCTGTGRVDDRCRRDADHRALGERRAAGNYKRGCGFHPLQAYLDETREALGGLLRAGNAGSNTAEDRTTVIDVALEQIPAECIEILIRAGAAGATRGLIDYCWAGNPRAALRIPAMRYDITHSGRDPGPAVWRG
jgi:hypothetical protein